jgi:hypothetical protein
VSGARVIAAVTGTPGSGKSYRLVCGIAEALLEGKFVATNIPLGDDWAERIAKRALIRRLIPGRVEYLSRLYRSRLLYSEDVDELLRARPGCLVCGTAAAGPDYSRCAKGHRLTEARGLWVLDEAHEHLNSRLWDSSERQRVVKWISRSRHRGWDVELGTQALDSLDKQLRDRVEYEVVVRNLKRARIFGVPCSPVDLFLCIHVWVGGPRTGTRHIAKRRLYLRDGRCRLYDTHGLRFLAPEELDGAEPIALPLPLPARAAKRRRWQRRPTVRAATAHSSELEQAAGGDVSTSDALWTLPPMTSESPATNGAPAISSDLIPAGRGQIKE